MAVRHETLSALFTDIAGAIRGKLGTTSTYVADNFDTLIESIETDPSGSTTAAASDLLSGKTAYSKKALITGTIPTKTSSDLTASGATVSVPSGYYASTASKSVASGSAATPATSKAQSTPTFSRSGNVVTANVAATSVSVTPTVSAGYITSGTAGTITMSESSASYTISTQSKTATANGTISPDSGYLLSGVTVALPTYDGTVN